MPRFRLIIHAKSDPVKPTKDTIRGILRAKLAPLKVKTTSREGHAHHGIHRYVVVYVDFTDDQVSGFKDWSAQKLPEILDEFKACGVEPIDYSTSWYVNEQTIPPLIHARVSEQADVRL